ncbi:MAG TPA: hypothetical protein DFS52_16720 [Myxococcales bacterium]|nr:hypothetical protein [Myxococcales bacterium]
MNLETRTRLLRHLSELATDAGAAGDIKVFLPLARHRLALRPEVVVVQGERGAGKTAMFNLVQRHGSELRRLFDEPGIPDATWLDAFSESRAHPAALVLDDLSAKHPQDTALRAFWMAHLLGRLVDEGVQGAALPAPFAELRALAPTDPGKWLAWAEQNPGALMERLDAVDQQLAHTGQMVFATYDSLDRIGDLDRSHRQRLIRALLSLWLSLAARYGNLRAKVFLRHDLFEDAERSFADASKLRPRSVSLSWDVESLFRLVVRHLANRGPAIEEAVEWLEAIRGLSLRPSKDLGLMPGELPEPARRAFATAVAGEIMGAGVKKGYTHRWIPDRLQDADGRIVPRSILRLLGEAARHALLAPMGKGRPLLKPIDLAAALIETSRQRSNELAEEYLVVQRLENLRGATMLLERKDVARRLARPVGAQDRLPEDGELVLEELRRIGVLEERRDGRIDVPDIYRYGYDIKRKGGVRRPR